MPATIGSGSTGDDVRRLQRALARQLLWKPFGPITGAFDAGLETSVKSFQAANGLAVDGLVGPATWAKLPAYREASPTLATGWTGPAVAWLQQALAGKDVAVSIRPLPRRDRRPVRPADRSGCSRPADLGCRPRHRRRGRRYLVRLDDAWIRAATHARKRLRVAQQIVTSGGRVRPHIARGKP